MKYTHGQNKYIVIAAALVLVAAVVAVAYIRERTLLARLSAYEAEIAVLRGDITTLKKQVSREVSQSADKIEQRIKRESGRIAELETGIKEESKEREALARELAERTRLSQTRIGEIEESLSDEYDLSAILAEWRPRTAHVRCRFPDRIHSGSGTLIQGDDGLLVVTNRHVTSSEGSAAESCTVIFPEASEERAVPGGEIIALSIDEDIAGLPVRGAGLSARALPVSRFCGVRPALGAEVIILGYPAIGSEADITATEGIVSGYDDPYFITSAKVEQGSSGGAVVYLSKNCLLGIPTFVASGRLESLARVLDINVIEQ